jgi:hypothetical protein
MPLTYFKIASVTVGAGGASSIDFTSIPSTYTDLIVKISTRDNRGGSQNGYFISINGSTSNFSAKQIQSDGSSTPASFGIARLIGYSTTTSGTANTFSNAEFYFSNYAGSNYKSISSDAVQENNQTTAYILVGAHLWSNTAAITSITFTPDTASFVQYSTATLYGIKKD